MLPHTETIRSVLVDKIGATGFIEVMLQKLTLNLFPEFIQTVLCVCVWIFKPCRNCIKAVRAYHATFDQSKAHISKVITIEWLTVVLSPE